MTKEILIPLFLLFMVMYCSSKCHICQEHWAFENDVIGKVHKECFYKYWKKVSE